MTIVIKYVTFLLRSVLNVLPNVTNVCLLVCSQVCEDIWDWRIRTNVWTAKISQV